MKILIVLLGGLILLIIAVLFLGMIVGGLWAISHFFGDVWACVALGVLLWIYCSFAMRSMWKELK